MDNFSIAENFSLLSKLMDIHGENSFKSKTYSIAAFNIEKLPVQLSDMPREKIFSTKGIGESVGKKIVEMLDTGRLSVLDNYIQQTPPGVVEMLNIKGLGPKKIHTLWKELGIETIGELLYACGENRLMLYKGFGEKTQNNIKEAIAFYLQHQGSFLYAQIDEVFSQVKTYLEKTFAPHKVFVTGAFRRQEPVIEELEFVIDLPNENIKPKFQTAQPPELLEERNDRLLYKLKNGLRLRLYTGKQIAAERLFLTTGTEEFVSAFKKAFPEIDYKKLTNDNDDTAVFEQAGIPYIPPCLRESASIIKVAEKKSLPALIETKDINGIIHSHSNWSDGINTIEEMANECIKKGMEYLVISDHSKAAAYANGLTEERIKEQHRYIDSLNKNLAPFRVFKSIECDILGDGSMDYSDDVLASFDLVIASVHSNLTMTEEKAMSRLLKAISNPHVRILGHMTGRLLLSRNGYPLNHKKIIDACAEKSVVIEINAHPRRLDMDWRWIGYALEKGVLLSINPDAHAIEGYNDIKYGVLAAQKGGLTKERNLSSFSLKEFEKWLSEVRKK